MTTKRATSPQALLEEGLGKGVRIGHVGRVVHTGRAFRQDSEQAIRNGWYSTLALTANGDLAAGTPAKVTPEQRLRCGIARNGTRVTIECNTAKKPRHRPWRVNSRAWSRCATSCRIQSAGFSSAMAAMPRYAFATHRPRIDLLRHGGHRRFHLFHLLVVFGLIGVALTLVAHLSRDVCGEA